MLHERASLTGSLEKSADPLKTHLALADLEYCFPAGIFALGIQENELHIHFSPLQIIDIERPIEVPQQGLLCDILWSDPDRVRNSF